MPLNRIRPTGIQPHEPYTPSSPLDDSLLNGEIEAARGSPQVSLPELSRPATEHSRNRRPTALDVGFGPSPEGGEGGDSSLATLAAKGETECTQLDRLGPPSSDSPRARAPGNWWKEFKGSMHAGKMKESVASVERGLHASTQRWKAILYPTLPWGLPAYVDSSRSGESFLAVWDILIAFGTLYTAFIIPLSLGLQRLLYQDGEQCLFFKDNIHPLLALTRWFDIVVDLLFFVDMILNFLSARWIFEGGTKKHWELVDDLDQIAILYITKDTFFFDFLGMLPLQYLDCIPNVSSSGAKIVRLFRLFKLLRLRGLIPLRKQLEMLMPNSKIFLLGVQIFFTFVLCAHLVGCCFFFVSFGLGDPDSDSFWQHMFLEGWVVDDGLVREDGTLGEGKTSLDAWAASFYWAVTTMSTIGYGDISPMTTPERLVGCVMMVIACSCFAWITGSITSILTTKPLCETRFDDMLGDVETFMSTVRAPADLRRRILNYYKMRYPNKQIWDLEAIIADIEPTSIHTDIVEHLFRDVVEMVPLLSLCTASTQREISTKLRNIYRMPGSVITYTRTNPDFMYIVRFGEISIKGWGLKPRTLVHGDIFGELAILGLSPDGLRMRTATAVSVVEVCQLAEEDLHHLLIHEPGFFNLVRDVCRTHMYGLRMAKERMAQISESDHFGKYTPNSYKQPVVKDFYEQLTTLRWREICAVFKQAREAEALRSAMTDFDDKRIRKLERMDGRKMLRTSLLLNFKAISFLQLDLSQVGQEQFKMLEPGGMPGMSAIIVVRWKGLDGMPLSCVQNETDRFFLDAMKGSPCIAQHLKLPIASPHGVPWEELPSLELCIMLLPQGTQNMSLDTKGALPERRANRNDNTGPIASKVLRNASVWLTGSLSLRDAVLKRLKKSQRKECVCVEVSSSDGFKAKLEVQVAMRRIPQCQGFSKLRHYVAAKGASPFFTKKLDMLLEKVVAKEEAFIDKIRSQRLSLMRSLRESRANVPAWTPVDVGGHPLSTLLEVTQELTQDSGGAARDMPSPNLHPLQAHHAARNRRAQDIAEELRALLRKGNLEEEAVCLAAHGVLDLEDLRYMTEDDVVKFGLPLKFRGLLQQVASRGTNKRLPLLPLPSLLSPNGSNAEISGNLGSSLTPITGTMSSYLT
jgi:CRP-like cAMP-binding protein